MPALTSVKIAYVALSPFFVDISSVANLVGLDKIQFRGIHLMRTVSTCIILRCRDELKLFGRFLLVIPFTETSYWKRFLPV